MNNDNVTARTAAADFASSTYFPVFLLVVTALLVIFEFQYNISLLNSISDPATTPAQADDLSNKGKLLAAFGLTWALFKGILFKAKSILVGMCGLAAMTFAGYWALDTLYDKVIENLDPKVKVMGFNLLSYRQDLLTGELEDPDIPKLQEAPVTGKIFMGAFPIVLLDGRFMIPAQDIVIRKADERHGEALRLSEEKWAEYSGNMMSLRKAHDRYLESSRKVASGSGLEGDWANYRQQMEKINTSYARFVDAAKRARGEADLGQEWSSYNANMNSIRSSHREFIDGSIKAARYGSRGTNEFRRQSGGLYPNANLPLSQFPELIKRSSHPRASQLRQSESRVIGRYFDGREIRAGEMPYFMSRSAFDDWIAQKAKEGLASAGLPANPALSKVEFLDVLRRGQTASGEELRQHEKREIGERKGGRKVLAGEVPYFMERQAFLDWSANLLRESMEAVGMPPNDKLTLQEFVEVLRKSTGADGQRVREAESKLVAKRPDGSAMLVRDVPYFMNRGEYELWVNTEVEKFKAMAMPTVDNVESLKNIKQVNAAIFVPPMAIISSLTSALVNAISLLLFLVATVLTLSGSSAALGHLLKKYSVYLMLLVFAALVFAMPSHVFDKGTALYDLETKLHQEVGHGAELWSRLSNIQRFFL